MLKKSKKEIKTKQKFLNIKITYLNPSFYENFKSLITAIKTFESQNKNCQLVSIIWISRFKM